MEIEVIPKGKNKSEIPDHVIDALARVALPAIQEYYKTEEGQQAFAKWKTQREWKEQITEKKNSRNDLER